MISNMTDAQYGFYFDIRRSVRYHDRRKAFFERAHQITSILTILLAGSVLFDVGKSGENASWLTALSVGAGILAAIDMVIGFSKKANLHHELKQRYIDLEQEIIEAGSTHDLADFNRKRLLIEREEPAVYRALDTLCHNELIKADGHAGDDHVYEINCFQRLTCHIFHWSDIAHA